LGRRLTFAAEGDAAAEAAQRKITPIDNKERVGETPGSPPRGTDSSFEMRRISNESALARGRSYAQMDVSLMGRVVDSMRSLVDSLAAWPGYRALVFIGDVEFTHTLILFMASCANGLKLISEITLPQRRRLFGGTLTVIVRNAG